MNENTLFDFFKTHHIAYQLFHHQPCFTTNDKPMTIDESGAAKELIIPGADSKNLFLKDRKLNRFFLVSVIQEKRVNIKALRALLGCTSDFSFGKPEELLELMHLTPGSVTPFGLMFDTQNKVSFILDQDFLKAPAVNFHPLRNDMTVRLAPQAFLNCMEQMGHAPRIIEIQVQ